MTRLVPRYCPVDWSALTGRPFMGRSSSGSPYVGPVAVLSVTRGAVGLAGPVSR
jgi:hypothetical protein